MDLSIVLAFLGIGGVVFVGFISNYLFSRTLIPDVLVLISLGFIIGPGLLGLVDQDMIDYAEELWPVFSAVALAMIMFDGGLGLRLESLVGTFNRSLIHTLLAFALSVAIVTIIVASSLSISLGWDPLDGILLGVIIGGTSGAVVIPIISQMNLDESVTTLLTIESALTDVLVIVLAMTLMVFLSSGTGSVIGIVGSILYTFGIAAIVGVAAGMLWLRGLTKLQGNNLSYMLTLAVILIIYAITDVLTDQDGSGAIAVLMFGLILGNRDDIARILGKLKGEWVVEEKISEFHYELSFFIRSFFFTYMGIIFGTMVVTTRILGLTGLIFMGLLGVRYVVSLITGRLMDLDRKETLAVFLMMPRGLSAAVLASYPLAYGIVGPAESEILVAVTLLTIVLTTITASVGPYVAKRKPKEKEPEPVVEDIVEEVVIPREHHFTEENDEGFFID